jgi:VWFA-related protein
MTRKVCGFISSILIVVSALPGVSALSGAGVSQEKSKDGSDNVVRISAQLVQIDVIVSDKAGKAIAGLKREDFELFDNNKVQDISHFAYETTRSRSVVHDLEETRTLPKAITAAEVKRVLAFVVDTLHMKPENLYRTRQMIENFIDKQMEPGDLALILPTAGGSGLFQQFTSDQRLLRRAADRLRPFIFSNDTTPYRSMGNPFGQSSSAASPMGMGRGGRTAQPRIPQTQSLGGNPDPIEEADVRATLTTLNNLINSMKQLPGRKLALFVSEGLRIFQTDTSQDLRQTTDLAARADVVFYTIDPRGLDPLTISAADDVGDQDPTDFLSNKRDDFRESQDSLNAIALDTGGKFFRDNNDIKRGLANMLDENSGYYLLGFQPEGSKWDGKYHKLKVAVRGRSDLTVSFRKGYVAHDDKPRVKENADPQVAENIAAISSPLVRRDIDLQLTPFYRDDSKQQPVITTLLHIDASQLHFDQVDGRYKDVLKLIGFVLDTNGKTVDGFSEDLTLNLLPEHYEQSIKNGFLATRVLSVKPGIYQMRVLVREGDTGKLGTANNYIEVPNLKTDRLALSSIFTSPPRDQQGKTPESAGQGATLSQRRFKRGSQIEYELIIYNAASEGHDSQTLLEMRTRVMQGGRAVYTGQTRPVQPILESTPPKRIITGGALTLGQLAPGDYTLEVTVTDKLRKKESRAVVRQEIDFSVE